MNLLIVNATNPAGMKGCLKEARGDFRTLGLLDEHCHRHRTGPVAGPALEHKLVVSSSAHPYSPPHPSFSLIKLLSNTRLISTSYEVVQFICTAWIDRTVRVPTLLR